MRRRHALGLGLVGVVLALLLWRVVGEGSDAGSATSGSKAGSKAGELALRARGPGPEPTVRPVADAPQAAPVAPESGPFRVRGRVTLPDGRPAVGALVRVDAALVSYARAVFAPESPVAADGTYALDVTPVFRLDHDAPVQLAVQAEHPRYLAAVEVQPVSSRDRTGGGRVFDVDLQLRRAAVVTGQLLREDGSAIANGWVRMLREAAGTVQQPEGMQEATPTDEHGRFRIAAAEDDARFVLLANAPGLAPASMTVVPHLDRAKELDPIVLEEGLALTGWLRVRGEPLAGMKIRCQRHWHDGSKSVIVGRFGAAVLWKDGDVGAQEKWTTTDTQGRFELTGLSRHEWHVRLHPGGSVGVHWDVVRERFKPSFDAPAHDVVIDLDGVWVTLRVVDPEGKPIPGMGTSTRGFGMPTSPEGRIRVLWPAHVSKTIRLRREPEYLTREVTLTTGEAGTDLEHTITMERAAPKPVVEVVLEGEGAEQIDLLGIALHQRGSRQYPRHAATLRRTAGSFRFDRAEPGAWEVEIRPDGAYRGGSGHYLPQRRLVLIPEVGLVRVAARLERGGRLQLDVRGPDGRRVPARCMLADAGGRPLRAFFWGRTGSLAGGSAGRLSSMGLTVVDPALPAGTYRVQLTYRGFEDLTLSGEVRAGETTTIRATMRRAE